jgi:PIN domain nuclease of toxin-antitoxin system
VSLLLDTHAALWYALNDPQLSAVALHAIENEPDRVFISPASYWEIAIKIALGKYRLALPFDAFWQNAVQLEGLTILPIEIRHASRVTTLPFVHGDPFDRMIVAQALCENLALVSNDSLLDGYNIKRIW